MDHHDINPLDKRAGNLPSEILENIKIATPNEKTPSEDINLLTINNRKQ